MSRPRIAEKREFLMVLQIDIASLMLHSSPRAASQKHEKDCLNARNFYAWDERVYKLCVHKQGLKQVEGGMRVNLS